MARDNAIEFTENKYASRKEMSNEIGIVVPNEMWNKVLNYRANFMNQLSLLDVSDRPINLCLYTTLASKCSLVESKLKRLLFPIIYCIEKRNHRNVISCFTYCLQ